jgi:uncharacterized protein YerC
VQTSSRVLAASDLAALQHQLSLVLADLHHPQHTDEFLSAFLTPTEYLALAKRLAILRRLDQGNSYEAIAEELKVSSATISTVAEAKTSPGLRSALKILAENDWANRVIDRCLAPWHWLQGK